MTVIDGVKVTPLRQIFDERGKVMHMLRNDDEVFEAFGEIYFSSTNPNAIKAWHLHKKMRLNYCCVFGALKLVLFDPRVGSSTHGAIMEIILSPENYFLVCVPPGIWNGFKCISTEPALLANCATIPHDALEIERLSFNSKKIPYTWDIKHG
jgi:dTDP-4-dehydrorhamnose 3,5-epimerase